MKHILCLLVVLLVSPSALATGGSLVPQEIIESYSFENDFEDWTVNGTDLNLGSNNKKPGDGKKREHLSEILSA